MKEQRTARAKDLMQYTIQERLREISKMTRFELEGINIQFDLIGRCVSILYANVFSSEEIDQLHELRNSLIEQAEAKGSHKRHRVSGK